MRFPWNETFINIAINNFISYWLEWTMECLVQPLCWNKLWMPFFISFLQFSVSYKYLCSWGCLAIFSQRSISLPSSSEVLAFIISTELAKSTGKQFRHTAVSSDREKRKDILKVVRRGMMLKSENLYLSVRHAKKRERRTSTTLHSLLSNKTTYGWNQ